jgi:hypothetical protein
VHDPDLFEPESAERSTLRPANYIRKLVQPVSGPPNHAFAQFRSRVSQTFSILDTARDLSLIQQNSTECSRVPGKKRPFWIQMARHEAAARDLFGTGPAPPSDALWEGNMTNPAGKNTGGSCIGGLCR